MTDAEKRMKKYTNGVERRLNLPASVKQRVMSDFISSIQARREAGMTDEEILTELGTPAKAAEELNEQMQEFTYRKSPWRFLFAVGAVYGAVKLISYLVHKILFLFLADPVLRVGEAASIGIIGGADGPTAIFLTTPDWARVVVPVLLVAVGFLGYRRLSRCRRKQ